MGRTGGRPRVIDAEEIIRAGRELGLRQLSLNAVASRLGVSAAALYRHVDGRWELERLVGESILAELSLPDDPAESTVEHLLSTALRLRSFLLQHPGLAAYVQTFFPRGESSRALLAVEAMALARRGYDTDIAIVLVSAVASVAIGYAAAEDLQEERAEERARHQKDAWAALDDDVVLGRAHRALPEVDPDTYVRLWLGAAIRGFVDASPPGRSATEIMAALDAAGRDR